MPIINGRYYANPQYGKALERDRIADEESRRVHGEPKPSWLDHSLGFASEPSVQKQVVKRGTNDDNIHDKVSLEQMGQGRSDRGALSYAEKTDGTVAEHEAMQSTVMNRVASGKRQYVGKGKSVNEENVIHAPHQYLGVPRPSAANRTQESNFQKYQSGKATGPGARNAERADQILSRTGKPANDATLFIVNRGGKAPSERQEHNLAVC